METRKLNLNLKRNPNSMSEGKEMTNLEFAHETRKQIDNAIQHAEALAKRLNRGAGGREASLVITKLQEGKMWGGKVCGEIDGGELPADYPHDKA